MPPDHNPAIITGLNLIVCNYHHLSIVIIWKQFQCFALQSCANLCKMCLLCCMTQTGTDC